MSVSRCALRSIPDKLLTRSKLKDFHLLQEDGYVLCGADNDLEVIYSINVLVQPPQAEVGCINLLVTLL